MKITIEVYEIPNTPYVTDGKLIYSNSKYGLRLLRQIWKQNYMFQKFKQYHNKKKNITTYIFQEKLKEYLQNTPIYFEFENGKIPAILN